MDYLNTLLFGYYPYIAISVFFIGSLARYDRDQYTWRTGSSQFLRADELRLGSNLFHIGILLLFVGHFVGLLTPPAVYHALGLSTSAKQILAVVAGGVFGGVCLKGIIILIRRRLTDARIRATSSRMDIFILLLIGVQLILGLLTLPISIYHHDGANMLLLSEWAQRIVTFRSGAADQLSEIGIVFKLHLFLGQTLFLVFPFSRLVHVWSVPLGYVTRPYQVVRRR
ncbi:respiratory nitrate reductase subunit gamma [Methylobacter sp. Wu8]|uniref:nitrate reductase (quinone) n=1 Tax=Methylobacter tundripaludum TaxID=173365 RepID=A0A2S6H4X3_9GAMM|nr:respiratory nitrate reductase subunit gamma [Methylobacter tundripaludum]MCF7967415.1 respiratory nitrate reductase subunit gamma [Methylobacter tundripaludum]MCK9636451.1 respiratory nitrate reductase subunit gamma [Methylobacter tundripaludum]PPK72470.1 respiratory nitrate reductase gamma subunit [Methylobacter tundripaludum]